MKAPRTRRPLGAEPREESSVFEGSALRRQWSERTAGFTELGSALDALLAFREEHRHSHLSDVDRLWVEARLEERVAVLRFSALSFEDIRYRTLTGEAIADVVARYENDAKSEDAHVLERLAGEFRQRYKPPIMPTADFMRLETFLSERLMKRRSLGWFDEPIAALRARRGATVLKDGWPG
jgi:methane monooxygenase component A gamma chain